MRTVKMVVHQKSPQMPHWCLRYNRNFVCKYLHHIYVLFACVQVELFDWKLEDLTKTNDGGILRQTLKVGTGYSSPNEEALVESRSWFLLFFTWKID